MDYKDNILKLVPEEFKQFLNNYDPSDPLVDRIDPNVINVTASLLSYFMVEHFPMIGDDVEESIKQLGLDKVLSKLPGIDTSNMAVEFLKALFAFKGTYLDLQYLVKLIGVEISVSEYGTDDSLAPCSFILEAIVDSDQQGIIDVSQLKDVLQHLLKNRIYFCTTLAYLKIIISLIDHYDFPVDDSVYIHKHVSVVDAVPLLGHVYGDPDIHYGDGFRYGGENNTLEDRAYATVHLNLSPTYGTQMTYGTPNRSLYYPSVTANMTYGQTDNVVDNVLVEL